MCDLSDKQSSLELKRTTGCVKTTIVLDGKTLVKKENNIEELASSVLAGKLNIDLEGDTNACVANTLKGTRCTYGIAKSSIRSGGKY